MYKRQVYTVTVNTAALPEPITPGVDNKKPASKPEVKLPFTDVSTSDWFYDDVAFVYENGWAVSEGLINGASGKLMPKGDATRAQVAAILHRFVKNVLN